MPLRKQDRSVMRRHFKDMLFLGVPFLALIGSLLFPDYTVERSIPFFIGGCVGGMVLAGVGLYRQTRRMHRFICPTCGQVLRRSTGKSGEPVAFVCKPCDTEWDTGFRESSD
jgi:hypothetical protein